MPKRYGKLTNIMQKQAVSAGTVSAASSAAADASSSVITSMPKDLSPVLEGISARLSDRGDLFKALRKIHYSVDGLTSALLGKKVQTGGNNSGIGNPDTTEAENESIKRDEKIIVLLEQIAENTGGKPRIEKEKEEDPSKIGIGGLAMALAAVIGGVIGAIRAQIKTIKLFVEALTPEKWLMALRKSIASFVSGASLQFDLMKMSFTEKVGKVTKFAEEIVEGVLGKVRSFFSGEGKIVSFVRNMVQTVSTFFETLYTPFKDLGRFMSKASSLSTLFEPIFKFFEPIQKAVAGVLEYGKAFAGKIAMFAKVFEKLFFPLFIIMTVWDTVKGAIEGYEKDGIVGILSGAIKGLVESLITAPLDMLREAIAWIAGAFGFDEAKQWLESFNVTDMMKGLVDMVFNPVVDMMKSLFNKLMSALENIGIPEITLLDNKLTGKVTIGPYYPFKGAAKKESAAGKTDTKSDQTKPVGASGATESKAGAGTNKPKTDAAKGSGIDLNGEPFDPGKPLTPKQVEAVRTMKMTGQEIPPDLQRAYDYATTGKLAPTDAGAGRGSSAAAAVDPRRLDAAKVAAGDSSSGSQVASASSEAEMAKSQSGAAAPVVIAPQTNVQNSSASTYAIKSPVRNPAPPTQRSRYAVA